MYDITSLKRQSLKISFKVLVIGLVVVLLTPVYFLVTLSFMSAREAYTYPLPLIPSFQENLSLQKGTRGYLISIQNSKTREFETILDTSNIDKMVNYCHQELNLNINSERFVELIKQFEIKKQTTFFPAYKDPLANFETFFRVTRNAFSSLINSLQIVGLTILLSISIGGLAGYSFARYVFKGKETIKLSLLFVRMFPLATISIPMVILLANIGLFDRPLGLSLIYAIPNIALTCWITTSIFLGIPVSLEESAMVFGAKRWQVIRYITLPLALPGLIACSIYAFLGAWNETLAALILTQENTTFSVVVFESLMSNTGANINFIAASGVMMAAPAVVFTLLVRKYFTRMWQGVGD